MKVVKPLYSPVNNTRYHMIQHDTTQEMKHLVSFLQLFFMFQQTTRHSSVLSEVDKAVKLWSWKERLSVPPSISSLLLHRQFVPGSEQKKYQLKYGKFVGKFGIETRNMSANRFWFYDVKRSFAFALR